MTAPRNDPNAPLTRFCLAVEEHRRTPDGRVRTSQQFLAQFFTQSDTTPEDRVFRHLPKEVRGPVISAWGIRGSKAALRDEDDKVTSVVSDALIAGDLSAGEFEDGLSPDITIAWVPLPDWWTFWRGGVLTKTAALKALVTAYDLKLFDASWLFERLEARGGGLKGTDVISEGLSKDDLVDWIRRVHQSQDGSPKGILEALGWEKLVAKTQNEALFGLLDALAKKVGLGADEGGATAQMGESTVSKPPEGDWSTPSVAPPAASSSPALVGVATSPAGAPPAPTAAKPAESGTQVRPPVPAKKADSIDIPVDDEMDVDVPSDDTKLFVRARANIKR